MSRPAYEEEDDAKQHGRGQRAQPEIDVVKLEQLLAADGPKVVRGPQVLGGRGEAGSCLLLETQDATY